MKRRDTDRLRNVVECLPYETRVAMLQGLQRYDRIIVGAYSDRSGGVCPMLAAHRCGGRTDFRSFARAWDRFTGAGRRARRASEREVTTLMTHIEASIIVRTRCGLRYPGSAAVQRRRASVVGRRPHGAHGSSWLRPFRRWDGYREAVEAALRQLRGRDADPRPPVEEREEELAGR